ncbi:MAG: NAD(P)H-binding protein [Gammaproteobacteria bacterium]|nr:NAD(P)H-binding protein [Gammaproteobacteria bacterium]
MGVRSALLVGATGLVGNELLRLLPASGLYSSITTLGRRKPQHDHALVQHRVCDPSALDAMPSADTVFCCLGTTIKRAGSRNAFRAVDFELVTRIASLAAAAGSDSFIVVSSVGADTASGNFYLRVKGEMEDAIAKTAFAKTGFIRPSLLLGSREEFRPAEKLGTLAARLINPLLLGPLDRYKAVAADTVAAAMIGLDQSDYSGQRTVEGDEIRRLAATLQR